MYVEKRKFNHLQIRKTIESKNVRRDINFNFATFSKGNGIIHKRASPFITEHHEKQKGITYPWLSLPGLCFYMQELYVGKISYTSG